MKTTRTPSPDAPSTDADGPSARFDFNPVPLRQRIDGWTPERQRLFLAALAETGHVGKAARAVGISERAVARLRARPEAAGFNAAFVAAYGFARRRRTLARFAETRRGRAGRSGLFFPQGSRTQWTVRTFQWPLRTFLAAPPPGKQTLVKRPADPKSRAQRIGE